ncbi:MAG: hypothetical protein KGL39_03440 [Patescibacteria group bacterium]|nr:hypothetical protein [Patescibacteria group bacterium]
MRHDRRAVAAGGSHQDRSDPPAKSEVKMHVSVTYDPHDPEDRAKALALLAGGAPEMATEPTPSQSGAPEDAAAVPPATRTRKRSAAAPDVEVAYVVKNYNGAVRATYSTSKDAADVVIVAGSVCETEQHLADLIDANLALLARLDKTDQERVKNSLAEMITKIKAQGAPAQPEPEPEADLDALMSGEAAAEPPAVSKEEFNKHILQFTQKAGPTATRLFGEPIIKKYGSIKSVPPSDYQLVMDAADEYLAKITT